MVSSSGFRTANLLGRSNAEWSEGPPPFRRCFVTFQMKQAMHSDIPSATVSRQSRTSNQTDKPEQAQHQRRGFWNRFAKNHAELAVMIEHGPDCVLREIDAPVSQSEIAAVSA